MNHGKSTSGIAQGLKVLRQRITDKGSVLDFTAVTMRRYFRVAVRFEFGT